VVELSQPEVHFVAPRLPCYARGPAGCAAPITPCAGEAAAPCSKSCSFLNFSINKVHGKGAQAAGGAALQPVTTVIPSFATATIPIAIQTTRFAAVGAEFGLLGGAARGGAEISRESIAEAVREAIRQESARTRETAREAAPAPAVDVCAQLRTRIESVEKRLDKIEKQVDSIVTKMDKLK
jgi:hypothetical protein